MKIYVLYEDYGQYEGCSCPLLVTTNEEEANEWLNKDEFGTYCVSEFEIEEKNDTIRHQ